MCVCVCVCKNNRDRRREAEAKREEERKSSVQINAEWADMIIKKHFLLGRNSDGAQ